MSTHLAASYEDLLHAISATRRRWRMKIFLRGLAILMASGFAAFALSVWGMNYFLYADGAVTTFRILTWVALAAIVLRFLVLPLSRKVVDEQVALYIEEHEPSLQEELVSALEFAHKGLDGSEEERSGTSPRLVEKLLESAMLNCQAIDYGSSIERRGLRRFSALVGATAVAGMLAILLSPAFLQHGALVLFLPWKGAAIANPYGIQVSPGNVTVARGADQEILATLVGFATERTELSIRRGDGGSWERWPMPSYGEPTEKAFMILDLQERSEYFVEAEGVRSPLFRIEVVDLPYVDRMDLEYHFPAYSKLSPLTVKDGGDIAALRGTEVLLDITPTVPVEAGAIRVEAEGDDEILALERTGEGHLVGRLDVGRDTFYRIELLGPDGEMLPASPDYAIEVLEDQPPVISFEEPGRDTRASKVEEVFAEVRVEDDYGIRSVELVYSVNGGAEQIRNLVSGSGGRKQAQVGHTFFLEDEDLVDGDFISYYAKATDTNRGSSKSSSTTDIFFIEVVPFTKNYREAQQGGGGAGQGGMANAMSQRQRLIISATFKLDRDRDSYARRDLEENLTTVALMQGRLREQVTNLITRMGNRLRGDDEFQSIIGNLEDAASHMVPAQERLSEFRPKEALTPEQLALKSLQRAEATFRDVQIARQAGGRGGAGQRMAEDLADLFQLELDKLHNQYETVQRGERQALQEEIDEALQRLKELARRQQQENERARRLASQMGASSAAGANQRQIIEQTEELARQLERLARERSRPDLRETARRLQQAADTMKKAMASRSAGQTGVGSEALEELRKARRLLERNRQIQLAEKMQDLQSRAERIERMQENIQSRVGRLDPDGDRSRLNSTLAGILEEKDELGREVKGLEDQIDRVAREARSTQKGAARGLGQASDSIRRNQLKQKIRYSKGVVRGRSTEYAEGFEREIAADIAEMQEHLEEARGAMRQSKEEQVAATLESTRDLVRGLESMQQRLEDRARRSSGSGQEGSSRGEEQGSEGQQGPEGREGSEGQQGAAGEQGAGERRVDAEGRGDAERGGDAQGGDASRIGSAIGGYQPGIYTEADLRQLAREFNRRLGDAEALRRNFRELGIDAQDFEEILSRMRDFRIRGINQDPLALESLREDIVEGLKQFEYRLWREIEGEDENRLYLAGADEVPAGYRDLVEEYFTTLAEGES